MSFIEQAGEDLWNAGMGIVLGGFQDARQVRQQDRLQRLQIAGQKEMTDYNMMKQLEMQTDVLAQELANKREDWNIKRLEQTMKNIENWEKQASQGDRLRYIEFQTKLAIKQLEQIENEVFVSTTTIHDQIKKIQAEAAGAVIQNSLMEAGIKLSTEQANLIRKQAEKILRESQIPWDQMSQENKKIAIQQMIGEYQTDPVNTHNITKLLDNIFILTKRN